MVAVAQGDFRAPQYTAGSITNAASNEVGAYAPNTFISIYGVNLSNIQVVLSQNSLLQSTGPATSPVSVILGLTHAYLFYLSPGQLNLLLPSNLVAGPTSIQVVRDGVSGAVIPLTLTAAAPALFELRDRYVIATTPVFTLVDAQHPAKAGDVVILWATGLGSTVPRAPADSIARSPAVLGDMAKFQVLLNGVPVDNKNILYAGLAPGYAGLFQVNLRLPENTPVDPEVVLNVSGDRSPAGRKLFVR